MWLIAVFGEILLCTIANLATKKFVKRKLEGRKLSDFFNGEASPKPKFKTQNKSDFGGFQ
jgi:hypothetical protein